MSHTELFTLSVTQRDTQSVPCSCRVCVGYRKECKNKGQNGATCLTLHSRMHGFRGVKAICSRPCTAGGVVVLDTQHHWHCADQFDCQYLTKLSAWAIMMITNCQDLSLHVNSGTFSSFCIDNPRLFWDISAFSTKCHVATNLTHVLLKKALYTILLYYWGKTLFYNVLGSVHVIQLCREEYFIIYYVLQVPRS